MGVSGMMLLAAVAGGVAASQMSKPPAMPALPDLKSDPAADAMKADGAASQQRKRAAAAASAGSTILTGPKGLGELEPDQQGTKNLLGY